MRKAIAFILLCSASKAADWTRFRGPEGSGVAETGAIPSVMDESHNLRWKTVLPAGHSSPVISDGRVFLTAFEKDELLTICLDEKSGKILWRKVAPRSKVSDLDKRNSPASPSPTIDGKSIYVFFHDFGMLSYDYQGKERWRVPMGPFQNVYGMGASPILAAPFVVLVCDQSAGSFIAAFDSTTGKEKWRTARREALSGHSTPVVKDGLIYAPGSFSMDVYQAATGEVVWHVGGLASEMKSVPVFYKDHIFISGYNTPENDPGRQVAIPDFKDTIAKFDKNYDGKISLAEAPDEKTRKYFPYIDLNSDGLMDEQEWKMYAATMASENGLLSVKLGGKGDVTASNVSWKFQRSIPQLPSTLIYRDILYMINDSGVLTTLNPATGELYKQARLRGVSESFYSSPVASDGKIFFLSRSGVMTVLEAGREQKVLAVNELNEESSATPAIANGRLYVRTKSTLYCFANQDKK